jgi:hypothetical protein
VYFRKFSFIEQIFCKQIHLFIVLTVENLILMNFILSILSLMDHVFVVISTLEV